MAEAILRQLGGGRFHAYSAGSHPTPAPMPRGDRTAARARPRRLRHCAANPGIEFTGPDAPRMDFVITLCDIAARPDLPRSRRHGGHRRLAVARPGQIHAAVAIERASAAERALRQPAPADRAFSRPCPSPRSIAWRCKTRLDEIGGGRSRAAAAEEARPCASASMAWAASAALRCAPPWAACAAAGGRSARRQPARCRACQRAQGRRRGDRASARIRQHAWPLARSASASRTSSAIRIGNRRIGFSAAADARRRAWGDLGCDIVLECTGKFLKPEQLQGYFDRGVQAA